MNNEYMITITTRFVEANDPENIFHENVFFFEMECLHCGVYLCPDSATAGVFAESSEIHRAVSQVWDGMDYASMIVQANEECGSRGMIDVCIHFLKEIGEWTVDAFELYQNSIMNPHDNNSGVSARPPITSIPTTTPMISLFAISCQKSMTPSSGKTMLQK